MAEEDAADQAVRLLVTSCSTRASPARQTMQTAGSKGGATWTLKSLTKLVADAESDCNTQCFIVRSESVSTKLEERITASRCSTWRLDSEQTCAVLGGRRNGEN